MLCQVLGTSPYSQSQTVKLFTTRK